MAATRPYMRENYHEERTPATTWLLCALAGAFILQLFIAFFSAAGPHLRESFALSPAALQEGRIWGLFTHWLLHSTTNLLHAVIVMGGLFLLGRALIPTLGSRRFMIVFAASIAAGAALWTTLHWQTGGELLGATAGVYGLLAILALLQPARQVNVLLLFVLPLTIRVRHLAIALLVTDAIAMTISDVLARPLPFEYASSSHLGGMLAGWACHWLMFRRPASLPPLQRPALPPPSEQQGPPPSGSHEPHALRAEVDRILDKINSQGLHTLTAAERKLLDEARQHLSRR